MSEERDYNKSCSVCWCQFEIPCQLECTHIFCFLCIKGSRFKCPVCRTPFLKNYLTHPILVKPISPPAKDSLVWFYSGEVSHCLFWWFYDTATNKILEEAWLKQIRQVNFTLSGHKFSVDFESMTQCNLRSPEFTIRHIKRDFGSAQARGIAGVYFQENRKSENKIKKRKLEL